MGPEVAAAGAAAGAAGSSAISPTLAAALIGGGTVAQMAAGRQQAKQQRSIINRAFEASEKTEADATDELLAEAQKMAPGQQAQAMKAAEDAAYQRTQDDLTGAGADIIDTAGDGGRQSEAFQQAKAERMAGEGERMSAIAREFARVRAPGQVLTDSAMQRAALAEKLGSVFSSNRQRAQAAQMDAQDVERPWYGDVGQIASMVGSVGMGMGGAGAATGAGTAGTAAMTAAPWAAQATQRRQMPVWMGR